MSELLGSGLSKLEKIKQALIVEVLKIFVKAGLPLILKSASENKLLGKLGTIALLGKAYEFDIYESEAKKTKLLKAYELFFGEAADLNEITLLVANDGPNYCIGYGGFLVMSHSYYQEFEELNHAYVTKKQNDDISPLQNSDYLKLVAILSNITHELAHLQSQECFNDDAKWYINYLMFKPFNFGEELKALQAQVSELNKLGLEKSTIEEQLKYEIWYVLASQSPRLSSDLKKAKARFDELVATGSLEGGEAPNLSRVYLAQFIKTYHAIDTNPGALSYDQILEKIFGGLN
jgi:hypothetical protein